MKKEMRQLITAVFMILAFTLGSFPAEAAGTQDPFPEMYFVWHKDRAGVKFEFLDIHNYPDPKVEHVWKGQAVDGFADGQGVMEEYVKEAGTLRTLYDCSFKKGQMEGRFVGKRQDKKESVEWSASGGKLTGPMHLNSPGMVSSFTYRDSKLVFLKIVTMDTIMHGEANQMGLNGKGLVQTPEFVYEGDFVDGAPDGQGKVVFKNGMYYEGSFKKGAYNGQGTLFNADGSVSKRGVWENGKLTNPE